MNPTKTLTALAAAAAAVATLTACDPGPGEQAAMESSTAAAASPSLSNVLEHVRQSMVESEREGELNAVVGLPWGTNRRLAEAAAKDGVPFVFAWSDWDERPGACAWVRTPDGALWDLNGNGAQLVRDEREEQANRRNPGRQPACFQADAPNPAPFDQAAADAANAAGVPYRFYATCVVAVIIPTNPTAFVLQPSDLTRGGNDLSTPVERMGCGSGVDIPKEGN